MSEALPDHRDYAAGPVPSALWGPAQAARYARWLPDLLEPLAAAPVEVVEALSAHAVAVYLTTRSPTTAAAYAADLRDLARWAASQHTPLLLLTHSQLSGWSRELLDTRRLSPATVRRRLAAAGGLYGWAVAERLLRQDPTAQLARPRYRPAPPRLQLTPADRQALLTAAAAHSPRAELLSGVLLLMGLRISEAVSVTVADVTGAPSRPVLRVRGKARSIRQLPVPQACRGALATQWSQAGGAGWLLPSATGHRWHRTGAARLLRRLALASLPAPAGALMHPHAARASYAEQCLRGGVPIPVLMRLLGHQHPGQTLAYADRGWPEPTPAALREFLQWPEGTL